MLPCDFCTDESGLLLLSNQENGDVQSIGARCMPVFLTEMSKVWQVWPDFESMLTAEVVEQRARELGIWPAQPSTAAEPATSSPKRGAGRPAKRTVAERAATAGTGGPPADYSQVPETLLTAAERAQRAAEATEPASVDAGG